MNPQQIKQLNDILNKKQNVSQKFISAVQMDDPETAIRFLHMEIGLNIELEKILDKKI